MTNARKEALRRRLERLEAAGVIRSYMIQSQMPGLRWTVEGRGTFGTRSYTTTQLDDFLTGAEAALWKGR